MLIQYLFYEQDVEGVISICFDCLLGKEFIICFKYFIGVDGGNLLVVEQVGLLFEGKMGVGGLMNILFWVDFFKYVVYCLFVFYWVMQLGVDVGGIGMGLVCMVCLWNEWLIVWGYDINQFVLEVDEVMVIDVVCQLVGDFEFEIELIFVNIWIVNNMYVMYMQKDWVFIMGDVVYCYLLLNGFGFNIFIQDSFNFVWKLVVVLKGQVSEVLFDSYSVEWVLVVKQIVIWVNQLIGEFGLIFEVFGMGEGVDLEVMQ